MPLPPGTRLGVYEVVSVLGAGGMGEVYRARDTRLGREVAIKVILEVFAADADRIARFEREAKVLASLNHPHIAALYGMEQAGAQHFLVMELVEGQTLADRLLRGPLPLEETIAIALQIAEALEAAHEKGVVHRDLKPANIKVTPDDRVKVLDFGLAKAMDRESSAASVANSPTLSMMASQAGVILGTAAYMSPEQAKGLPADHRSDIFSFGTVVFEMLTGRQPFSGETAPEILASVLVREADLTRLPPDLAPRLAELVRRCLEKQPRRRWQAIGDVRAEIEAVAAAPRALPSTAAAAPPRQPMWKRALPVLLLATAVGVIAGAAGWLLRAPAPQPVARFSIVLPAALRFSTPARNVIAVSPDGTNLVYLANSQLYLRSLAELEGKPIPGTSIGSISSPVFSPDGRSLAFFSATDQAIKKIAVTGGTPISVGAATNPYGMSWGADGILFGQSVGQRRGVFRVSPSGPPEVLVAVTGAQAVYGPQMLPGGHTVLFTLGEDSGSDRWEKAEIVAQTLGTGARKTLMRGASDGRYLPTGHLAYAVRGVVYVIAFDLRTLTVSGDPVPIIEGVRRSPSGLTALADFGVSSSGLLAYVPGPVSLSSGQLRMALVDERGTVAPLKLPPAEYLLPRVSPDDTRVAFAMEDGRNSAVYVYSLSEAAAMQRITFEGRNQFPVWSADGRRITFQSNREGSWGVFWQAADGRGTAERLTQPAPGESHVPLCWHRDGDALLFEVTKGQEVSLWVYSRRNKTAAPFGAVRSSYPTGAVFSPDGRWVAYSTTEEGATNLFVQPFPATGEKYQFAKTGGGPHHPMWAPDGTHIFSVPEPGTFDSISVTTTPGFAWGTAQALPRPFEAAPPTEHRPYDIMRDGRFVGLVSPVGASATAPQEIHIVLNWFEELKGRLRR